MKVLVIDDDIEMASFLRSHLPRHGFVADTVHRAASGISSARVSEYDLILLDLHLPDMSGESIIDELRIANPRAPILILTVVSDASSKARVLNAGADDFLPKPFLFEELIARMHALLRRSGTVTPDMLYAADITLNVLSQCAQRNGRTLPLTRKEFAVLEYLLRNKDVVVSKASLVEHLWDASSNMFSLAIDTHVSNLRKKVGKPGIIETVHSRGYIVHS